MKAGDVAKGSVSAIMGRDAFPPALSEVVECGQVRTGDVSAIADRAVAAGLRLMHSKIRHIGAGYSKEVLQRMYGYLVSHGVTVHLRSEVDRILTDEAGKVRGIRTAAGEEFGAEYVIVAPGRGSSEWLTQEAKSLLIPTEFNPV